MTNKFFTFNMLFGVPANFCPWCKAKDVEKSNSTSKSYIQPHERESVTTTPQVHRKYC